MMRKSPEIPGFFGVLMLRVTGTLKMRQRGMNAPIWCVLTNPCLFFGREDGLAAFEEGGRGFLPEFDGLRHSRS